jgi:HEPN domain-containing protein
MKKPVADWLFLAESDLRTAKIAVKDEYPLTNIVAFHCQQAIEKYLKAYLIENEVSLIKTHDLVKLNDLINGETLIP